MPYTKPPVAADHRRPQDLSNGKHTSDLRRRAIERRPDEGPRLAAEACRAEGVTRDQVEREVEASPDRVQATPWRSSRRRAEVRDHWLRLVLRHALDGRVAARPWPELVAGARVVRGGGS